MSLATFSLVLLAVVAAPLPAAAVPPIPRPLAENEAIKKAAAETRGHFKVGVDEAVFRKVIVLRNGYVCGQVSIKRGPYMRFAYMPATKTSAFGIAGYVVDDGAMTNSFNFVYNGTCPA